MAKPLIDASAMLKQLHEFCSINSGSTNLVGLASMHNKLKNAFKPLADAIESPVLSPITSITMTGEPISEQAGQALLIRKRPHLKRRILLCGHMDTVYDANHPFQTLTLVDDNILNGPGVADMKGGLIVMLHALQAFEKSEYAHLLGWDVFINTDEEIGSAASNAVMMDIAKQCQAALVYEPSMTPDGVIAKNRKGNLKVTLVATGIAAHAGRDFNAGRNAICFLAEVVLAIDALNGKRDGVTLNIGKIAGGNALNIVPDRAVAKIDIRISHPDDEKWLIEQLKIIETQHVKQGHTLTINSRFDRPVKCINKATERLFSRLCKLGNSLDIQLQWRDSGGCCDGNNLAQHGLAVLDTLGVRGGKIHTPEEFILLDSLAERASLSTLLLADLACGGLEALY